MTLLTVPDEKFTGVCNCISTCPYYIWTAMGENVPPDMCAQRRHKSARACAQSDQNLHCPQEETFYLWISKIRPVKFQTSLREWREGAHRREGTFPAVAARMYSSEGTLWLFNNFSDLRVSSVSLITLQRNTIKIWIRNENGLWHEKIAVWQ